MLCVEVELLANRYHATPWGRAANEGDVEWPPSPWRLGRALADSWYRLPIDRRPDTTVMDALLRALSAPPRVLLPPATVGHTRHYMPLAAGPPPTKATLVLDAFVRTREGARITFAWDEIELGEESQTLLGELLAGVGYLGRAESPVVLGVSSDGAALTGMQALPLADDAEVPPGTDPVRTLVMRSDVTLESLSESTAALRRRRVSTTPGGRFATYVRPADALEPAAPARPAREERRHVAVRFAVDGAAPPTVTEALALAELVRRSALSKVDDGDREAVRLLRGRLDGGEAERGHRHCHYLATDEDGDGRLDHVTVWCADGLTRTALAALDLRRLTSWRLDHPLHLVPLELIRLGEPPRRETGPLGLSRTWISHTPFLCVRHIKRRGGTLRDGPVDQILTELARRGLPRPAAIDLLPSGRRHWGAFRQERSTARGAARTPAVGARLHFHEQVRGPIALGRHSHFGMGLFLPSER